MTIPLVEMDGDEMAAILWRETKEKLILPFVDLKEEYYDLGIRNRDETNDQITIDAAMATKKYGVAVKCATITPNLERVQEYSLKKMWKSPNGTIRAILDGTVFRAPILIRGISPYIKSWKKPITLARHAYGDLYRSAEMRIEAPGICELVFTAEDGTETRELIHTFTGPGVAQEVHNLDPSRASPAAACLMPWNKSRILFFPPRIPFPRYMTEIFGKYSSRFLWKSLWKNSKLPALPIPIV